MFLKDNMEILNRIALIDAFDNRLTYRQLEEISISYTAILKVRTVVAILCDYDLDTVSFYYAAMSNRVVPLLVDKNLNRELLIELLKKYEPKYIWVKREFVVTLEGIGAYIIKEVGNHVLIETQYSQYSIHDELALLLTTSGTTGSNKLVRITYNNIHSNSKDYVERIGLQEDDIGITTLPMHYCYGLAQFHIHWYVGACMCITDDSILNTNFWRVFEKNHITNFSGVPYTYEILEKIGFFDKKYETLRFLTQGGGKLQEDKQLRIGKHLSVQNVKLFVCYGQTEGCTFLSVLDAEQVCERLGSIGNINRMLNSTPGEVIKEEGDNQGELVFNGSSVSLGYAFEKKDLNNGDSNGAILYTGDIVELDDEGYIYIKGRKKRFIKILGERISLDEVENLLNCEFSKHEFVCAGKDNCLVIYFKGNEAKMKDVEVYLQSYLHLHKKMITFVKLEEIPRNTVGKVLYSELG